MVRFLGIAIFGLAVLLQASEAIASALVLRLVSQAPFDHPHGRIVRAFKEGVEGVAGDVVVEIYPAVHLYRDEEAPDAVAVGAVDLGALQLSQFAGRVPAAAAFTVPFLFDTDARALAATLPGAPLRVAIDAAILKTGVRVLSWQVGGGSLLLSRDAPMRRPADLKGRVVRVAGAEAIRLAERLGATPVPMAEEEGASAVRRGTVGAALAFAPLGASAEGMGAVTATLGARRVDVLTINEKVWRSLSPHQRAAMQEAARRAEDEARAEAAAPAASPCGGRLRVVCLSAAERALWRGAAKPQIAAFLERAAPLGGVLRDAAGALK